MPADDRSEQDERMDDRVSTNGRITIDPAAVVRNWRTLAARTAAECGAVAKANAYGCGLDAIVPTLVRAGCRSFFVATSREAMRLRRLAPSAAIYVLNGVFEDARVAWDARLIPFISCGEALQAWPEGAPFVLNVDTGFNRLGFRPDAACAVTRRPALIASHFACADRPSAPMNAAQEAAFAPVRAAFAGVPASFANTAALLTRPAAHHALVRPGIGLYGGLSAHGVPPLEPAVRMEARVIQVREARAGETVGYGGAQTLSRDTRIAIAAAGYADGVLRAAGGSDTHDGAPCAVGGAATRIIGRVSMDLIAVDVTDIPCARGDHVELFGPTVPLDQVAERAGTIGYELLTQLSRRADRHYGPL